MPVCLARRLSLSNPLSRNKTAIQRAKLTPSAYLLDLGAGTGDLTREALHQQPAIRGVAADFNLEMMHAGQISATLPWMKVNALHLPFPDKSFDVVISGFLIRNAGRLTFALIERYRILKKNGRIVILETTRPRGSIFTPLIWIYMHLCGCEISQ